MANRILIVSALFPPEPVVSANLSYDIASKLADEGRDVVVLTPIPSRPLNYHFPDITITYPFEHILLHSYICPGSKTFGRLRESYSFGRSVSNYLAKHYSDIGAIYINSWPLFSQWLIAKTARRYNIPYCIHVQDVYPESFAEKAPSVIGKFIKALFMPMDKFILCHAKKVIAISPSGAKYLSETRRIPIEKIPVVRNWQNDENFIRAYTPIAIEPHKTKFIYLGSINPTANVEFLLTTFAKIDSNKFLLSIIGNGSNKESCKSLTEALGLKVEFGIVAPEEVPAKQSEADVLILSLKEGIAKTATPSKLTAYLFSGRPIIACVDLDSDCADIIRRANVGDVVAPDDTKGLQKSVERMINLTHVELNKMGESGIAFAKRELSKEENLRKITQIIKEL